MPDFGTELNLMSNFAAVLGPGNKALKENIEHTEHAKHGVHAFEGELGKLSGTVGGLTFNLAALGEKGGSIFTFDLAEAARGAYEVVEKLVDKVIELGKEFITTAGKAQDLNLAIELDVGDEGARQIDELAETFAKKSRFDDGDVKRAILPLLEQGITDKRLLGDLTAAATDLAARRNQGIEGVQAALDAFSSIAVNPQRMRGALKELKITQAAFNKDLADLLHTTPTEAAERVTKGLVDSQTILSVALNQVAQREGGKLGTATLKASQTLGGTLARLGNLKENAFESLANSDGIKRVQDVLNNFVEVMHGPAGEELVKSLGDDFNSLVTSIFGSLTGESGLQKMESAISSVRVTFKSWTDDFVAAWPSIKQGLSDVFEVAKATAEAIAGIAHWVVKLRELTGASGPQAPQFAHGTGIGLGKNEAGFNVTLTPTDIADLLERAGKGKGFQASSIFGVTKFKESGFLGREFGEDEAKKIALEEFQREQAESPARDAVNKAVAAASTNNTTVVQVAAPQFHTTVHANGDASADDIAQKSAQEHRAGWTRMLAEMKQAMGAGT